MLSAGAVSEMNSIRPLLNALHTYKTWSENTAVHVPLTDLPICPKILPFDSHTCPRFEPRQPYGFGSNDHPLTQTRTMK